MNRKLVSILLTLAVTVSLLVIPAAVSADGPEVTVPFGFSADGRPELKDGSVSLVSEDLVVEFTAVGQNAKPDLVNKYVAIWFDVNIEDKDLNYASQFDTPWDEGGYVLVYNWFNAYYSCPDSLSWRPSYDDPVEGYQNPWGSPVPSPTTIFFGDDDWPDGLSLVSVAVGDDITWTATVPTSLLGVEPGDTFGMLVAARDENPANDKSLNSWPELVYGYTPGYDLRDYALVTIPNTSVGLTADTPTITAINVDPTDIDFGTVMPGDTVSGNPDPITVTNIGTVTVDVGVSLNPAGGVYQYLYLNGDNRSSGIWTAGQLGMANMLPTDGRSCTTELQVPATYSAQGEESATLIFEVATA